MWRYIMLRTQVSLTEQVRRFLDAASAMRAAEASSTRSLMSTLRWHPVVRDPMFSDLGKPC